MRRTDNTELTISESEADQLQQPGDFPGVRDQFIDRLGPLLKVGADAVSQGGSTNAYLTIQIVSDEEHESLDDMDRIGSGEAEIGAGI